MPASAKPFRRRPEVVYAIQYTPETCTEIRGLAMNDCDVPDHVHGRDELPFGGIVLAPLGWVVFYENGSRNVLSDAVFRSRYSALRETT